MKIQQHLLLYFAGFLLYSCGATPEPPVAEAAEVETTGANKRVSALTGVEDFGLIVVTLFKLF